MSGLYCLHFKRTHLPRYYQGPALSLPRCYLVFGSLVKTPQPFHSPPLPPSTAKALPYPHCTLCLATWGVHLPCPGLAFPNCIPALPKPCPGVGAVGCSAPEATRAVRAMCAVCAVMARGWLSTIRVKGGGSLRPEEQQRIGGQWQQQDQSGNN